MSLPELLSELPDGGRAATLSWAEAIAWLRDRYLSPVGTEAQRIAEATERSDFYRDRGAKYVSQLIDHVFDDPEVKRLRDKWVEIAGSNNATRRVVHELATLYRRPARRSVTSEGDDLRYQTVQQLVGLNAQMLEVQRLAILHRSLLVGFRVPGWSRLPQLTIVEPQSFRLVAHPLEPTRLIAVIIDQHVDAPGMPAAARPAYLVWTATETFRLSQSGHLVGDIRPHTLGRIPFVLVALSPPPGQLIDYSTFRDVIRAHKAVWFETVLLLKESKSATKTTVLTGDTSRVMRKQMLDSEGAIQVGDGVGVTSLDMAMPLDPFRQTADHILERAAANHGIPPSILRHDGATSGYEIELRYVGVRERRIEQEPLFRVVERELAELMSTVLASDLPELAFDTTGWSINFGDTEMPRHPREALEIFEHAQRLGLTDLVEEELRRDPDITEAEAWDRIRNRIANRLQQATLQRPLRQIDGALGANTNPDPAGVGEREAA